MERAPDPLPLPPAAHFNRLCELLEEHRDRLLGVVRRRLDPALSARLDAEEVLQEVFLRARDRWEAYRARPAVTPYAWLYGLTRDCLIEAWRREARQGRDYRRGVPWPEESSLQLGLGLVSPGTSPSSAAARADLRERMCKALGLLKDEDRDILWMRHHDGLTFPEAAGVLGVTESAATLRYVRALRRLKAVWQELNPRGGEQP